MGDPKVYMNDAPKGYTEHIKYDRTKYRGLTKKELAKEEAKIYKQGVRLSYESDHNKHTYAPVYSGKPKRDPRKPHMIFKKRYPDGTLVPYTGWDTAKEAFM